MLIKFKSKTVRLLADSIVKDAPTWRTMALAKEAGWNKKLAAEDRQVWERWQKIRKAYGVE